MAAWLRVRRPLKVPQHQGIRPHCPPVLYPALQGAQLRCANVDVRHRCRQSFHQFPGGRCRLALEPIFNERPCLFERIRTGSPPVMSADLLAVRGSNFAILPRHCQAFKEGG